MLPSNIIFFPSVLFYFQLGIQSRLPWLNETDLNSHLNNFRIISEFLKEKPWAHWRQQERKWWRQQSRVEDVSCLKRKDSDPLSVSSCKLFRLGWSWERGLSPSAAFRRLLCYLDCSLSLIFELLEHSYTLPWNRTLECFFLLVLPSYTRALHLGGLKYGHFGETGKGVSGAFVSKGNFSPEFQTFFFLIYQLSPVPHPEFPLTLVFVKSMFPNRLIKCTI